MENLRGFSLVPESSAAAFFVAGALALLVVRLRADANAMNHDGATEPGDNRKAYSRFR